MNKTLDDTFKTVVSLDKSRFNVWKILEAHKLDNDLLITFVDDEGKKYAVLEFDKLLEILYGSGSSA